MKQLLSLCLSVLLLFLPACQGHYVPNPSVPSPRPGPQAPVVEPEPRASPAEPESEAPAISPAEYYAMLSDFHTRLMDEALILIRAGLYEYNWWGSYAEDPGGVDLTAMVELVMEWLSETLDADADTIAAARGDLIAAYAAIQYANVDGEVSAEAAELSGALMSAYYELYTIVTGPSGTVRSFSNTLCSCVYTITTSSAELASVLETCCQPEGHPLRLAASSPAGWQKTGVTGRSDTCLCLPDGI